MSDNGYTTSRRPDLFDDAEDDPYRDRDLDEYPAWWRENVEIFNEFGLRPYRPPRFEDGELTTNVIREITDEYDVNVRLRTINPQTNDRREIWIDDEPVARVSCHRDSDGYTVYELASDEFTRTVYEAMDNSR